MRRVIVLVAACALPTALFAQTASEQAAPAAPTAPAAAPEEKPSCRAYQRTGSIMPGKRICHTKAEWHIIDAQMAEAARSQLGRDHASGTTAPN